MIAASNRYLREDSRCNSTLAASTISLVHDMRATRFYTNVMKMSLTCHSRPAVQMRTITLFTTWAAATSRVLLSGYRRASSVRRIRRTSPR
jgi:hypothetical protein